MWSSKCYKCYFCSSIPVVLFDNPEISKCLNMLFLLSHHLCFIIGFIFDLFDACYDSWMSWKISSRTEQLYMFTTMEAEGQCWDPVKLA